MKEDYLIVSERGKERNEIHISGVVQIGNTTAWRVIYHIPYRGLHVNQIWARFVRAELQRIVGKAKTYKLLTRQTSYFVELDEYDLRHFAKYNVHSQHLPGRVRSLWEFIKGLFRKGIQHARSSNYKAP